MAGLAYAMGHTTSVIYMNENRVNIFEMRLGSGKQKSF